MITSIEIENFKAFGKPQRIDLRPLTLLYGPNSSGKSSVIHAIHYAYEVLVNRNYDVGRTELGGDQIDLGGFRNIIHNRDLSQSIRLKFDLDLSRRSWPNFPELFLRHEQQLEPVEARIRDAGSASIQFAIRWDERTARTYCSEYTVWVDGDYLIKVENFGVPGAAYVAGINENHAFFIDDADDAEPRRNLLTLIDWASGSSGDSGVALRMLDGLPVFEELPLFEIDDERLTDDEIGSVGNPYSLPHSLMTMLGMAMVGPGLLLREELRRWFRYVGPIRAKPSRQRTPSDRVDSRSWWNGLAAWDYLATAAPGFIESVSNWLSDPALLDTGYELQVRRIRQLDEATPLYVKLAAGLAFDEVDDLPANLRDLPIRRDPYLIDRRTRLSLHPHDVGEGIAQVLPVVVGLLAEGASLVAVEQPEYHVHQRVQLGIGDLLVDSIRGRRQGDSWPLRALVETHGEPPLLRVMTRVKKMKEAEKDGEPALNAADVSVLFIANRDGEAEVRNVGITDKGDFGQPWPDNQFEVDFDERFAR
jgi:hypothetical protein